MTASLTKIDAETRGAGIKKVALAKLLGLTPAAITGRIKRGDLQVLRIGGIEFIATAPIRKELGLPVEG